MNNTCNCAKCNPKSIITNEELEETLNFVQIFDSKIDAHLATFRAFGCHTETCLLSKHVSCCWHFSEYYCHYVGFSSVGAWLRTCAERNLSLSTILQDFAFLATFINDVYLVANLARGIAMYFAEFTSTVFDKKERKFSVDQIKFEETSICTRQPFLINTGALLASCGWLKQPFLDSSAAIESCLEIMRGSRSLIRLVLANEAQQKTRQLPFLLIVRALVACFCTSKDNLLGCFLIDFYGECLPLSIFSNFPVALKPVLRVLHGKVVCERVMLKFVQHRCVTLLADEKRKNMESICHVESVRKRILIDAEREKVKVYIEHCRFILLDFFFNYIFYSSKFLLFLHMNPTSLDFLNAFRIVLTCKSEKLIRNFSLENLLSYKCIELRTSGDARVSVAPNCFNCGLYIEKVWPSDQKLVLFDKIVSKKSSVLCECLMARYCSAKCANLHHTAHLPFCTTKVSVRSNE